MHLVEVSNLRVDYDEITAVQGLSFQLKAGQIYGFVGPNGAGKTSTIKTIAGVIEPTEGDIFLNGLNLETEREKALATVGYMPDFSPVYENLKVWEYLDVFAAAYSIERNKRKDKISEWLNKVNLLSKKDAFIKGLSRGMRQRLVLAKTLINDPQILLLDEPASGLDPISRKEMRDVVKEASNRGAAVLISSHILTELSEFIDSVIILEKGHLVIEGSIEEIRNKTGLSQKVMIRFLNEQKALPVFERLLNTFGITNERVKCDRSNYVVHFINRGDEAAHFLKEVLNSGIDLSEFSLKKDDVEDIFFKLGTKEVA